MARAQTLIDRKVQHQLRIPWGIWGSPECGSVEPFQGGGGRRFHQAAQADFNNPMWAPLGMRPCVWAQDTRVRDPVPSPVCVYTLTNYQ